MDLAILRLAVFEMKYGGIPAAVSINEAVENTGEDIMDARKDVGNFGVIVKNEE